MKSLALAVLVSLLVRATPAQGQAEVCEPEPSGDTFELPYARCGVSSAATAACRERFGPASSYCCWFAVVADCATGEPIGTGGGIRLSGSCACNAPRDPDLSGLDHGCDATLQQQLSCEIGCDGLDNDGDGLADESCEPGCRDQDGARNNLATGALRSTERRDLVLPSWDGVFVGLSRRWLQGFVSRPGYDFAGADEKLSDAQDAPTFVGFGWRFAFDDTVVRGRVVRGVPEAFTWRGESAVRFASPTSRGSYLRYAAEATSPGYELRYYATREPRLLIVRTDDLLVWEFRFHDVFRDGDARKVGLLAAHYRARSLAGLEPGYGVRVTREPTRARIVAIADSEGRQLTFRYAATTQPGVSSRVTEIAAFAPPTGPFGSLAPSARIELVYARNREVDAMLNPAGPGSLLERVVLPDGSDERYLYVATARAPVLAKIVVPTLAGVDPPPPWAPPSRHELVLEAHELDAAGRVSRTETPSQRFGYLYGLGETRQFDLTQPQPAGASCEGDAGCAAGYACFAPPEGDGGCYRENRIVFDGASPATAFRVSRKSGACPDCAVDGISDSATTRYDARGLVRASTDLGGMRTTYAWDDDGRPTCIVVGDDDDRAEPCAGPPPGRR
jgi:YD repeat-containing protein